MANQLTQDVSLQSITVPLRTGDRVTLYEEVDMDTNGAFTGTILFEDVVAQYIPQTGLLEFEDSDIGRAEFNERIEQSEGIQII